MIQSKAQDFLEQVFEMWPIVVLSGGMAFLVGLPKLRASYKQQTRCMAILNQVVESLITGILSAAVMLLLPVLQIELDAGAQVGLAAFLGCWGSAALRTFVMRRLGLRVVDIKSRKDFDMLRESVECENSAHCCRRDGRE